MAILMYIAPSNNRECSQGGMMIIRFHSPDCRKPVKRHYHTVLFVHRLSTYSLQKNDDDNDYNSTIIHVFCKMPPLSTTSFCRLHPQPSRAVFAPLIYALMDAPFSRQNLRQGLHVCSRSFHAQLLYQKLIAIGCCL